MAKMGRPRGSATIYARSKVGPLTADAHTQARIETLRRSALGLFEAFLEGEVSCLSTELIQHMVVEVRDRIARLKRGETEFSNTDAV